MENILFNTLEKIIKKELKIGIKTEDNSIILKESEKTSKITSLKLEGFTDKVFAFKMDSNKISCICNIFNRDAENINKGCDAIIISEINNERYVFVCELKSDNPKGYTRQIKSGHAFLAYLDGLLEKCYDDPILLKPYKIINILFFTDSRNTSKQIITNKLPKIKPSNENGISVFKENCRDNQTIHIRKFI